MKCNSIFGLFTLYLEVQILVIWNKHESSVLMNCGSKCVYNQRRNCECVHLIMQIYCYNKCGIGLQKFNLRLLETLKVNLKKNWRANGKVPNWGKNLNQIKNPKTTQKMKTLKTNNNNEKTKKNQEKMLKQQMKIKGVRTKWKWKYMSNFFLKKPKLKELQMNEGKKNLPQIKMKKFEKSRNWRSPLII